MEIHTRELKRELRNTETDRDLWKDRYILRLMRDGTTIERAIIERDNWQHKYESEIETKHIYLRQSAGRTPPPSNDARLHLASKDKILNDDETNQYYEPLSPPYSDMASTQYSPNSI